MQLVPHIKRIARDNRGATAIEYGLILAMVFLAMVGAVTALGGENGSMYDEVSSTAVEAMQATV
jgi:pilus assembly protein Flp/PilA